MVNRQILLAYLHIVTFLPTRYFVRYADELLYAVICVIVLLSIKKIVLLASNLRMQSVYFEITPPAYTHKSSYTTEQLFSLIHNLGLKVRWQDRILGRNACFSFEIVSTRTTGIRYIIKTDAINAQNLKRNLLSYLPYLLVTEIDDYLDKSHHPTNIVEFKLKSHFAIPLKRQDMLQEHDPIAYLTGNMTKLQKSELISFQLVISPVNQKHARKKADRYMRRITAFAPEGTNQWVLYRLSISLVQNIIAALRLVLTDFIYGAIPDQYKNHATQNTRADETRQHISHKLTQPLFTASIRVLLQMQHGTVTKERSLGFIASLMTFASKQNQSLVTKRHVPFLSNHLRQITFRKRLISLVSNKSPLLLSVSEIADLYHFPFAQSTQTENIVKLHSKELPAPLSLKTENGFDITFAKNTYGGETTMIGLTKEERLRHMYIIGATGTGKTTLLQSMIHHDLHNNKGICVIDPHGDLAETLLTCIPERRKDDLIYFNPDDISFPIGLNLLELTTGLDEDDTLREKELITESVISLFRKIFSDAWAAHGHRLEYTLRNTIQTALTLANPTLFTVYELLTNPEFQKQSTANLEDVYLKNYWENEFEKAGDFQRVKMIGPVTARIGRFLFSPSARRILEQTHSTINFDKIMDEGKILICNLSKGKLGEDTSEVLGILVLTKIQLASLKRARLQKDDRMPFYLYVDEFQNFATPSFIQMLSEARKYGINLVMAEQSTSQQKDRNLVNVILANVGTTVSFRSANPDDEKIMLPQFTPFIDKGEIMNLPSFHFFMRIAAISPEEPFSGTTMPIEVTQDKKRVDMFIKASRDNHAIKYQKPAKTIIQSNKPRSKQKNKVLQPVKPVSILARPAT